MLSFSGSLKVFVAVRTREYLEDVLPACPP
jgi:hypothetical protein